MQTVLLSRLRRTTALCLAAALCALPGRFTSAQQAPPSSPATAPATPAARAIPRPEDLEPGVNTTTMPAAAEPAAAPAFAPPPVTTSAPSAPPRAASPAAAAPAAPAASGTAATTAPAATAGGKDAAAAKTAGRKGSDRIELDTTDITGNRELPKVLYIVPWKRSDLGDVVGRPVNSLLDEVLQPLDRDVFQRENRYYDALKPSQDAPKPGTAQGSVNKP